MVYRADENQIDELVATGHKGSIIWDTKQI